MISDKNSRHWEHLGAFSRFENEPSELFTKTYYQPIIDRTKPLYYACSLVNLAHVLMLVEEGLIPKQKGINILRVMLEMDRMDGNTFPFDEKRGNIYLNMESYLFKKLGEDVGGWAYIGRSRLDYEPTFRRVYVRDQLLEVIENTTKLLEVMLTRAKEHVDSIMPGYSHLQHSQPCTFGHYLLAFVDAFLKDIERFKAAFKRTNLCPLGAAAAAGHPLKLNREKTANLLGFRGFIEHSREACFSRDYAAESYSCCSIFMSNLGQLATDLDLFCTHEFNMIELADEYSGTSSSMPQKKNPLPLQAIRAYNGYFIGLLPSLLGVMKTNSEEVDIIEFTPDFGFESFPMLIDMTRLMREVIATMNVNKETMKEKAYSNWSTASALALHISREVGLSWRTAHRIVGRLVRNAIKEGCPPLQATKQMLDRAAERIIGNKANLGISTKELREILKPENFICNRSTPGSTNPKEVRRMIEHRAERLEKEGKWCDHTQTQIRNAYHQLREKAKEITQK